jgi:hypothetical protein
MRDGIPKAPNQSIAVASNVLKANLGDCFRLAMPRKSNFFAGSEDLEAFSATEDDRKVPEVAPPDDGAEFFSTVRREPSLLELLLR